MTFGQEIVVGMLAFGFVMVLFVLWEDR